MNTVTFGRSLAELAWRQWTALGVTGWTSEAQQPVDPEALVVFTARLGDADARLRDAATDWCVRYGDFFTNERRLRSVIGELGNNDRAVSSFLATVAVAGGPSWHKADAEPRPYVGRGKAHLPHLNGSGRLLLRLRAIYGVGARAELIAALVGRSAPLLVTDLVQLTRYTRPMIDRTLGSLALASLVRIVGGRRKSAILNAPPFAWLDARAPLVDWTARYAVALDIHALLRRTEGVEPSAAAAEARRTFATLSRALDRADLIPPDERLVRDDYVAALDEWESSLVASFDRA
jgi:hypothetical protein